MVRRLALSLLMFSLLGGGVAHAAEPPNQNDPCSRNGRDTCGTTGEGSYRNYRYGIRWFGDYRGAVDGRHRRHVLHRPALLVPVEGVRVRAALGRRAQEQGRRRGLGHQPAADEPGAVALRALQRRGAAGRGDGLRAPADGRRRAGRGRSEGALGGEPGDLRRRSCATPSASPGPYKVRATLPDKLVAGQQAAARPSRCVNSAGRRVPDVDVNLAATGADGLPASVTTGSERDREGADHRHRPAGRRRARRRPRPRCRTCCRRSTCPRGARRRATGSGSSRRRR